MQFNVKTLVAAVALVAAGQAFAITSAKDAAGSEVIFYAWDKVTQTSYVYDTGLSFANFRPTSAAANTTQSFSLASDAAWNSFTTSIGSDFTNTTWGVVALRQGSASKEGWDGITMATTVAANDDLVAAGQQSGAVKSINSPYFDAMRLSVNAAGSTAGTGVYATVSNGAAYWGYALRDNYAGKMVLDVTNTVGSDSYKFFLVEATKNVSLNPIVTEYANQWSFDGSTLAYAAVASVPEPESYAMLLAGLGLMGLLARRRRAA